MRRHVEFQWNFPDGADGDLFLMMFDQLLQPVERLKINVSKGK